MNNTNTLHRSIQGTTLSGFTSYARYRRLVVLRVSPPEIAHHIQATTYRSLPMYDNDVYDNDEVSSDICVRMHACSASRQIFRGGCSGIRRPRPSSVFVPQWAKQNNVSYRPRGLTLVACCVCPDAGSIHVIVILQQLQQ